MWLSHENKMEWGDSQWELNAFSVIDRGVFTSILSWRGRWDFQFCGFGQFLVRFFGFSTLKLRVFGLGVSRSLRVFSNLAFGFRFWSTMMAVFRIFLASAFDGFSGFAEEVTPCSRAKALFPKHHSQLEECMASLTVSLAGVVGALFGS